MRDKQKTIKKAVTLKGKGLHTGKEVTFTYKPAPENYGYKIKRIDIDGGPEVEAVAEHVASTDRGTVLKKGDCEIYTPEHSLAAAYALGIDNLLIEIDAPEVPIMDGSSKYFIEAIKKVGVEEQKAEKDYFEITEKLEYYDKETGTKIVGLPDSYFSVDTHISFASTVLSNQYAVLERLEDFEQEIAMCRTFVFFRELEPLLKSDLIKGGDLKNAIIILDKDVTQEEVDKLAKAFNHHSVNVKKIKPQGIFNNLKLHYENEPARHKLLDIVGDLALVGKPIKGKIIATCPGHRANTNFAKIIRDIIVKEVLVSTPPKIDLLAEPLLNIDKIQKLLPHRPPFLLVDRIYSITKDSIVGVKNVTMNEPFFVGHFPDEPVMPGVLQIEAMAQAGGIFVLHQVEEPEKYSTYFLKLDAIKFRKKVVPGDTLIFKLKLLTPIRRGIVNMEGRAFVGGNIVAEAVLMAQVVKTK